MAQCESRAEQMRRDRVRGSIFPEYKRYSPDFSFRIIDTSPVSCLDVQ